MQIMRIQRTRTFVPQETMPLLSPFICEDRYPLCESFGGLRIEAPPKFQCVAAQAFAAFGN